MEPRSKSGGRMRRSPASELVLPPAGAGDEAGAGEVGFRSFGAFSEAQNRRRPLHLRARET